MGSVNWLAVVLAAFVAAAVMGAMRARGRPPAALRVEQPLMARLGAMFVAMLVASVLIGHNFARVGAETLAAKPWLYWMMSGGWALMIAVPVLYVTLGGLGVPRWERLAECSRWVAAFLVMGTVFWLMG